MAVRRSAAAARRAANKPVAKLGLPQAVLLLISAIGFPAFITLAGLGLLIVIIIMMFTGSQMSSYTPDPSVSGLGVGGSAVTQLLGGDGRGELAVVMLPDPALAAPIKAAANECDLLTPVVLAAQIKLASNFDAKLAGPDGRMGLSQLTREIFDRYGEDSDQSGQASPLDAEDSIYAHAKYFCHLARETKKLRDDGTIIGDHLTVTLLAWQLGLAEVKARGGMPIIDPSSYPFQVRALFPGFTDTSTGPTPSAGRAAAPSAAPEGPGTSPMSGALFDEMFPSRNPFYTYAGLTDAMAKFPAFAATGDEATGKREMAAFLANIDHESGGLAHIEELNQAAWGNYCDAAQPYGCPAGQTAYHGRGPIQLSWNNNYKAAGDALGVDLLNNPDLVKTDPAVAWGTALWFWMTQTGAGPMTGHAAITGGGGFGGTIRSINGALECDGGNTGQVLSRVNAYKRFTAMLGVDPGDESTLTC